MLKYLIVLCAIAASAMCRNTATNYNSLNGDQLSDKMIGNNDKNDDSFLNWIDISSIYQKYNNYTGNDISVFLKMKLLQGINSVAKKDLDFGNGIRFVRDDSSQINDNDDNDEVNENAILKSMPRTLNEQEDILSSLIWKRISKLMRSHTLQVSKQLERTMNQLMKFMRYMMKFAMPKFILDTVVFATG